MIRLRLKNKTNKSKNSSDIVKFKGQQKQLSQIAVLWETIVSGNDTINSISKRFDFHKSIKAIKKKLEIKSE